MKDSEVKVTGPIQDEASETTQDVSSKTNQDANEGILHEKNKEIIHDVVQDVSEEIVQDANEGIIQDASEEVIQSVSGELTPYDRLKPGNPGITIRFYKSGEGDSTGRLIRFEEHDKQPSFHDTIVSESRKVVRGVLIVGNPFLRCYLFRLPIEVRAKIYEALFTHDGSALEIGRLKRTGIAKLAILRTCHAIYHEASIALYHSLSHRLLFIRTYGSFTADVMKRHPKPLPCCRNRRYEKWLEYPCPNHLLMWEKKFGAIIFLIGAADFKLALQRRWAFSEFITTLRMANPVKVYSLTIVVTDNWKMPGFDEKDLIMALFSGAFEFLGQLKFRGFNAEERSRLGELIEGLRIPKLKIEREKKIQRPGLSNLICKFFFFLLALLFFHLFFFWFILFFAAPLFCLGLLDALEHKIDDREENITISFSSLESESNNKESFFVWCLHHNGTCYLTSIELTNCLMSRKSTSQQRGGSQVAHREKAVICRV